MNRRLALFATIALLVAASPAIVYSLSSATSATLARVTGQSHTGFDHPESLPDQASDHARDALDARGSHGDQSNGAGDHEAGGNAADVSNSHDVQAGEKVTVTHSVENGVVDVNVMIVVTPGEGVEKTITHTVTPPTGHEHHLN